jgi:uncharacterized protein
VNDSRARLELLVVQPTPFCNLDCSYCYLPDRDDKRRIRDETLEKLFQRVDESELAPGPYTVVWHAGEPMVLEPGFYRRAFALAARHSRPGREITHSFQTNGTRITEAYCQLIQEHSVRIGVSIDGPAFLNDARRKTRSGKGTHARVLEGIATLKAHRIPFHVITVLTRESLDYPDELHAFYVEQGIEEVGFNIEEIEGPHADSSLRSPDAVERYQEFMSRFFDLAMGTEPRMQVREFESMVAAVMHSGGERVFESGQESTPFSILSVDHQGNFGTFSPELLGLQSQTYDGFGIGNVWTDSFDAAAGSPRHRAMARDIAAGVGKCRTECQYFDFCGGGAPANKYFENGTFDSTETLSCRLHRQALAEVVLSKMRPPPTSPIRGG